MGVPCAATEGYRGLPVSTRGDQRITYIGDQDVLLDSVMQLLSAQRDVTTGCKGLLMKSVADLSALASPGWMIKVSSCKITASSMMSWCAQLATGLVGAGCLMLG